MNARHLLAACALFSGVALAQGTAYVQPMTANGGILRNSQLWIDPTGQNDLDSDAIAWEDFELPRDATIAHVRWWGETAPPLGFRIRFYAQDPGTIAVQPDMFRPGSGPLSEEIFSTPTQTSAGGSMYRFDAALATPMTFQAHTRYFVSIVGRTPIAYATWSWASSIIGPNGTFWWMRGLHMYFHLADERAMALATTEGWPAGEAFCTADGGAGIACPCGNAGDVGNGCGNSAFAGGANLVAYGGASVANDSVALFARDTTGQSAVYFQGDAQAPAVAIDDGIGCVGGTLVRLGTVAGAGASSFPSAGGPSISVRGAIPAAGGTRYYQCFYRNAASTFCPPATSNRTNGVAIAWSI